MGLAIFFLTEIIETKSSRKKALRKDFKKGNSRLLETFWNQNFQNGWRPYLVIYEMISHIG